MSFTSLPGFGFVLDSVRSTRPVLSTSTRSLPGLAAQVGLVGELDPRLADRVAELVVRRLRLRLQLVVVDLADVSEHVRGHLPVHVLAHRDGSALTPGKSSLVLAHVGEHVEYGTSNATGTGVYGETRGSSSFLRMSGRGTASSSARRSTTIVALRRSRLAVDRDDVGDPVVDERPALGVEDPAPDRRLVDHAHRVALRRRGVVAARRDLEVPEPREERAEQAPATMTPTMLIRTRLSITTVPRVRRSPSADCQGAVA